MQELNELVGKILVAVEGIHVALAERGPFLTRKARLLRASLIGGVIVLVLAVTLSTGWLLFQQVRELRSWVAENQRVLASALAHQRAWVGPTVARVDGPIEAGKPVTVVVEYANTGREAAVNLASGVDLIAAAPKEEVKLQALFQKCSAAAPAGGLVVFPSNGAGVHQMATTMKPELSDKELADGTKVLVVSGCFVYRSAGSDAVRHTYFCYAYNAKQGNKQGIMGLCNGANAAD